jgi:hypothetical protein
MKTKRLPMASIGEATTQIKIAHAVGLANLLRAISMRGLIMLAVIAFGVIWAFDAYEYDAATATLLGSKPTLKAKTFRKR